MYPQHLHDKPRTPHLSLNTLQTQNRQFSGTGGVSAENRAQRFRPAFMDRRTGEVYPSRFGDGRPAPIHLLDGLPASAVLHRTASGRVTAVHGWLTAGFTREGRFFTREQAAAIAQGASLKTRVRP
jgi:hypothetical protein